MEDAASRRRDVRKLVSFTSSEWESVRSRMNLAGASSFDSFARRALLDGEVRVVKVAVNPLEMREDIARLGNNLNQIARLANQNKAATDADLQEVRDIMRELQKIFTDALRAGK